MTTSPILRVAAFVAGLVPLSAAAEGPVLLDTLGDWRIYFSEALGNSCLAMRVDDQGRQFQIGVDRKESFAYAGLFVARDAGVSDGETGIAAFELGDTVFIGETRGYARNGVEGGFVYFDNLDFAYELARQQTLTVNRMNGDKITVDLTGSARAIDAVIACQIVTAQ